MSKIVELIPGGYPATPQHENVEYNLENKDVENKTPKNDVKSNAENDVEKKTENKDLENKENTVSENKSKELENKENDLENKNTDSNKENEELKNKENDLENKNTDSKNKENEELKNKENISKSFPLKFEPNRSEKPADDNNYAKATTNKGSSALGGIGLNPASMLGIGSDSPPHPFYQDIVKENEKSQEFEEPKTFDLDGDHNKQKEKEQIAEPKNTFDLNGDYNEQKGREQKADQQQKEREQKADQQQKDERIDLGVKPLGNQPLPSPYKPESEGADRSVHHKQTEGAKGEMTPGKTTAVHPEKQNSGPRITKKDKVNATIGKAVGIFKQKIGKLVKNDDLVAKGEEKKAEAEKTKELAEVQKTMNEF